MGLIFFTSQQQRHSSLAQVSHKNESPSVRFKEQEYNPTASKKDKKAIAGLCSLAGLKSIGSLSSFG